MTRTELISKAPVRGTCGGARASSLTVFQLAAIGRGTWLPRLSPLGFPLSRDLGAPVTVQRLLGAGAHPWQCGRVGGVDISHLAGFSRPRASPSGPPPSLAQPHRLPGTPFGQARSGGNKTPTQQGGFSPEPVSRQLPVLTAGPLGPLCDSTAGFHLELRNRSCLFAVHCSSCPWHYFFFFNVFWNTLVYMEACVILNFYYSHLLGISQMYLKGQYAFSKNLMKTLSSRGPGTESAEIPLGIFLQVHRQQTFPDTAQHAGRITCAGKNSFDSLYH